jgi:hypothetical protein
MNRAAITFALVATLPFTACACRLTSVEPKGNELHIGTLRWSLGEADDVRSPSAWQGPLHAGSCSIKLDIIEGPFALTSSGMLFVNTYSGSERELHLVDLRACKIRWKSGRYTGKLKLDSQALQLGQRSIRLSESCMPLQGSG